MFLIQIRDYVATCHVTSICEVYVEIRNGNRQELACYKRQVVIASVPVGSRDRPDLNESALRSEWVG
jgi:hypothetical protein